MGKRYVGIDTTRGFGIFIMISLHCIIEQIGQQDSELFIPLFASLSVIKIILLSPLIIFSIMGTVFTLLTTLLSTIQMISIFEQKPKKIPEFIRVRCLIGFLLIFISRSLNILFAANFFQNKEIYIPSLIIAKQSLTLDSIAWCGVLVPITVYFILLILKEINVKKMVISLVILSIITYGLSPIIIILGNDLIELCNQSQLGFFAWVIPTNKGGDVT